jgi:hypothetical protein
MWSKQRPFLGSVAAATVLCILSSSASAMSFKILGDQLILSGRVVDGDYATAKDALRAHPEIRTAILRDSPGGHISSGYSIGELFRQLGVGTAVSGKCYSACSRMFLGGTERRFTDDYSPAATQIGFHGHYQADGRLNPELVQRFGLKRWVIKYSDGKADPDLVERWINIPVNKGMLHFYHPVLAQTKGASSFLCQGTEPTRQRNFGCEKIGKSAVDVGVVTSTEFVRSNDYAELRAAFANRPPNTGYAAISDLGKVPLSSSRGLEEYTRFLEAEAPKAFAVAPGQDTWAWNSETWDAMTLALSRCEQRAGQPCFLYAVDEDVVWQIPGR